MGLHPPSLTALLVCDLVIEDKITNKKSLIGTFTDIWAPAFPCFQHRMAIYFCLTEAEGEYQVMLRLVQSETDAILFEAGFQIVIPDRLAITDFGVNLPTVQLPAAGRYEVQLFVDQALLGRQEFRSSQLGDPR